MTGAAAFNIRGLTLHSAKLEKEDVDRKMSDIKKKEWLDRHYLDVNEVSMMDSKLITKLHNKLCSAKSSAEDVKFGGINIIFCGDFLQIPSVSEYRLYSNKPGSQHGNYLWHSLNAVVRLEKQMRQAKILNMQRFYIVFGYDNPRRKILQSSTLESVLLCQILPLSPLLYNGTAYDIHLI
jgi:hypothetical protein